MTEPKTTKAQDRAKDCAKQLPPPVLPSPPETPEQAKARRKRNTTIAAVLIAVILVAGAYSDLSRLAGW